MAYGVQWRKRCNTKQSQCYYEMLLQRALSNCTYAVSRSSTAIVWIDRMALCLAAYCRHQSDSGFSHSIKPQSAICHVSQYPVNGRVQPKQTCVSMLICFVVHNALNCFIDHIPYTVVTALCILLLVLCTWAGSVFQRSQSSLHVPFLFF